MLDRERRCRRCRVPRRATVCDVSDPVGELHYRGDVHVRSYRRGIYLGGAHLEQLIERALGHRFSFGQGWRGYAVVSIELYEREPDAEAAEAEADSADAA